MPRRPWSSTLFPTRRSSDLFLKLIIQSIAALREQLDNIAQGEGDLTKRDVVELLPQGDRKSTRLNSSHVRISYAALSLKKNSGKGLAETALQIGVLLPFAAL